MPLLWWMWFRPSPRSQWVRETVVATVASAMIALVAGRMLAHYLPFRMRPGIVKLSNGTRSNMQYVRMPNLISESPQHRSARHAFPRLEDLGAKRPLLFCVGVVTAMQEQIAHLIMDRSETLQVTR